MSVTPQAFHFHLQQLPATDKYLIAYSGGVDSHVLLHLCAQLKNSPRGFKQSFSAVYIDHGLSAHAKKWGRHCQHICYELDIPLTIIEVDARAKNGQGPEASARTARYQAFSQLLDKNEALLTAQHLDDQAETLLLQLLRGSGNKGLSAMPMAKVFAKGFLCRPMLDYTKQAIMDYARQHQLDWIEDESNSEERFDRNYLRHTVLPLLEQRWPATQANFAKSAGLLSESQLLLDELASTDIQALLPINEQGVSESDKLLLIPTLKFFECDAPLSAAQIPQHSLKSCHEHDQLRLNISRLKNMLRYWIHLNHLPMPSKKILEQIIYNVIQASADAMPMVSWRRDAFYGEIRRYRNTLYLYDHSAQVLLPLHKTANHSSLEPDQQLLSENQTLELPQTQSYVKLTSVTQSPVSHALASKGFAREKLLSKALTVKFRQGGERFRRTAKSASHTLKHWFQEQGIPPWERDLMPLIFWGDELIQVGNYQVTDQLNATEKEESLAIHCLVRKNN